LLELKQSTATTTPPRTEPKHDQSPPNFSSAFQSQDDAPKQPTFAIPQQRASPAFSTPAPSPFSAPAPSAPGTKNPRDILVQFYQTHNPAKVAEVDRILEKYRGKEESLFRNLAARYKLDPSHFGLPAATPPSQGFGSGGSTFGATTPLSGASSAFGQTSTLGSGSGSGSSTFGNQQFGAQTSSQGFSGSSFGAIAQSSTGFGGAGSSPFGSSTPFGSATPFGAARR